MGRALNGESTEANRKRQLVDEVCDISKHALQCARWHRNGSGRRFPFLDWYLVLQVEESVELDVIRKQYLKLALQLHPDKNKHHKADFAFKLLSEAYACLSDNTRRAEFNLERINNICIDCSKTRFTSNATSDDPNTRSAKTKGLFPTEKLIRLRKVQRKLSNLGERMSEEIRVVENCLRTNNAGLNIHCPLSRKEYPVFNPADYLSRGYPHLRTTKIFQQTKMGSYQKNEEYPVFGLRSQSRSSCLR